MKIEQYYQLLFLLIILLPFAMMTWRTSPKWRIAKHLLAWGGIILFLYVIGKTVQGPQANENDSTRNSPFEQINRAVH